MKRHDSLVPLSRFHKSVLFLALIAKKNSPAIKGYPTTLKEKKNYALSFYEHKLEAHFQFEEEKLLPNVRGKNKELDELADEIVREHLELRKFFKDLRYGNNPETELNNLGVALKKHIRKEERKFFQKIQRTLTPQELNLLILMYE